MIINIQTETGIVEQRKVTLDEAINMCKNGIQTKNRWAAIRTTEGDTKICTDLADITELAETIENNILEDSEITIMHAVKSGDFTVSAFAREDLEDDALTLSVSIPKGEIKFNLDHGVSDIAMAGAAVIKGLDKIKEIVAGRATVVKID